MSSVDELEALVLGEVGVVVDVERGEWKLTGDAAGGDPESLTGRARPRSRACAWISPHTVVAWKLHGTTRTLANKARRSARRRGPQRCRYVHWVSSPTVTKVTESRRPASRRGEDVGQSSLEDR
jgi:hypothetical protein